MGPHSFKCGKLKYCGLLRILPRKLQWGRTLSSAERSVRSAHHAKRHRRFNGAALFQVRKVIQKVIGNWRVSSLQWGRTLSSAESLLNTLPLQREHLLQWGRTLSSAESHPISPHSLLVIRASMGPHSFKCGKIGDVNRDYALLAGFNGAALFQVRKEQPIAPAARTTIALQWGRTLSSAERRTVPGRAAGKMCCFNGAALFQVRKASSRRRSNLE